MDIKELVEILNFSNIGWQILTPVIFSLFDIITGVIQAIINHDLDSTKMRSGLLHKVLIIIVILMSFIIDITFKLNVISIINDIKFKFCIKSSLHLCYFYGMYINFGEFEKSWN